LLRFWKFEIFLALLDLLLQIVSDVYLPNERLAQAV